MTAFERAHEQLWLDGRLIPSRAARVGLFTHALHYGTAVFDGCRFRRTTGGTLAVFRLEDHLRRFLTSARLMLMEVPYTQPELRQACLELITRNKEDEGYLRMLAWYGDDAIGIGATNRTRIAVLSWRPPAPLEAPARLRIAGLGHGASWLPTAKLAGQYARAFLARRRGRCSAPDDALFLDGDGFVTEATGANVFVVHGDRVVTPPRHAAILRGMTRDTLLTLMREAGYTAEEIPLRRDDLLTADEILLANSSQGITPVGSIEGRALAAPGPVTRDLRARYLAAVSGEDPAHRSWLTVVS